MQFVQENPPDGGSCTEGVRTVTFSVQVSYRYRTYKL